MLQFSLINIFLINCNTVVIRITICLEQTIIFLILERMCCNGNKKQICYGLTT